MSARILDGKAVAAEITAALADRAKTLAETPGLAVILVGEDPASQVYVRNKGKTAERLGYRHWQIDLPADTTEDRLLAEVRRLNDDPKVHGILVQFPVPKQIRQERVVDTIDPRKDVDGLHPRNAGLLAQRRDGFVPCTPAGVMELLKRTGEPLSGRDAIVIGRSNLVGKPMVQLLEQMDCTVTLAHSRTRDLAGHVQRAEIVIAAVGRAEMVKGAWIRPGALVIDVGINRLPDGRLVGDVEFAAARERAAWITPVPGGVGPMTIAMLMANTLRAAQR
ncbi:MAG: bifunctional methylenetetrahydrofolate dehydrogenase/methenyltetrahydrofolate cyclohydrolase FolD [Planctomycetes bacterium]|nr:bifunctional methylenetetrahydrofolate dehydrogenase/methenyltetrahydrofolate cyclohydrolase FolD [Planctomycetota bacterium]